MTEPQKAINKKIIGIALIALLLAMYSISALSGIVNNQPSLVFHQKLTTNQTWVNITGLNINNDGAYRLEVQISSWVVGGTNVELYINNDFNNSNYTRQFVYADGGSLINARDHDPGIVGTQQNWAATAVEFIYLDAFGKSHYVSQASLNVPAGVVFFNGQYTYDNFSSNITTLSLYATTTTGIGNGSEIWLLKV